MRTDCAGTVRQVRPEARFPLTGMDMYISCGYETDVEFTMTSSGNAIF
jgi:hypothetical protein